MIFIKMKKQFLVGLLALVLIASLIACSPEKKTFTIIWDVEGVTSITTVDEGATPSYDGAAPTKASTAEFDYIFSGWSPAILAASANATYTAQFTPATRSYTIIFQNHDNTQLQSTSVAYGTTPVYNGATPAKASTAEFDYIFSGWSPAILAASHGRFEPRERHESRRI